MASQTSPYIKSYSLLHRISAIVVQGDTFVDDDECCSFENVADDDTDEDRGIVSSSMCRSMLEDACGFILVAVAVVATIATTNTIQPSTSSKRYDAIIFIEG